MKGDIIKCECYECNEDFEIVETEYLEELFCPNCGGEYIGYKEDEE